MIFIYNKDMYPKTALIKAAYHFTDSAYLHLDSDGRNYVVNIEPKSGMTINEKDFENEMLAQTARYEVYQQTKSIREISLARALASSVIELIPENQVSEEEIDAADEDILKDWFEKNERVTIE